MAERVLAGTPAAPGAAAGPIWHLAGGPGSDGPALEQADRAAEGRRALAALEAAAGELDALATTLAGADAEIVAAGALLARDPALAEAVLNAIADRGVPAGPALVEASAAQAAVIAALPDPMLAERSADVRSVGRRAAALLSGAADRVDPAGAIVVADDLGPADVARLAGSAGGFALADGGSTAHAAILARSLGVPMAAALGAALLDAPEGADAVVDGDAGIAVLEPSPQRAGAARRAADARRRALERVAAQRDLPAVTTDGRALTVLANVAAPAEVDVALRAGAEGVGLLRTELAFLDAPAWPAEAAHRRALEPVLAPLAGRPVTVRTLDFGGDKSPPFLRGDDGADQRGIALQLAAPEALAAQLRAIVAAGARVQLRILLPLVAGAEDVRRVRGVLGAGVALGAMVETPEAAAVVDAIAAEADFLSIGTNDLTAATLGVDRFAAGRPRTHDPRVLTLIARTADAARAAGIPLEICGEAASDPLVMPLLVGLGATELSVGASRVGVVRAWVRALDAAACTRIAGAALLASSAAEVERLVAATAQRLAVLERGDERREGLDGVGGVGAVRAQA